MRLGLGALVWALVIAAAIGGCAPTDGAHPDDAGPEPPPAQPARRLVLETVAAQTLAFRQTAEISVRYEGDDGPIVGEAVRFALVGSAQDSTLSQLDAVSDDRGRASVTLTAGGVVAAFQVRASAERAAPAYTDVGVSDVGFGAVTVEARYDGRRAVTTARVAAYGDMPCTRLMYPDDADLRPPDVERDIGTSDGTAMFAALPSGVRYALLGRAYGPTGVELARGCVDRVEVAPGEQLNVHLFWEPDHPVRADGGFAVSIKVLALGRAQSVRSQVRSAVGGAVALWGGDGSMFLNEVLADVEARDPSGAEALRALFATSSLTGDLSVALAGAGAGPWRVASDASDACATVLSAPTMRGTLNLMPGDGRGVDALFVLAGIRAQAPGGATVDLAAADLLTPATLRMTGEVNVDDYLAFGTPLSASLGPAALVRRAIATELGVSDDRAMARVVERAIDCDTYVEWVASQPLLAPSCSSSCALAACGRVTEQLVVAIESALDAIADDASTLTSRSGPVVVLLDTTGDLLPDAVSGAAWEGSWGRDGNDSDVIMVVAGEPESP